MSGVRGATHHLVLSVGDLAAAMRDFYRPFMAELGYELRKDEPEMAVFYNPAAQEEFALAQATTPMDGAFDRYRPGFHHTAWWARSRADVNAMHEKLQGWGVPILDAPADYPQYGPGYYAVFFTGPDGLKFEFTHQERPA